MPAHVCGVHTELSFNPAPGWGFVFGFNYTEHLNVGFEYTHNAQDYKATIYDLGTTPATAQTIRHTLDNYGMNFNFTYNILAKTFTPFVGASMGWTELDSNVVSSVISTGCYWDPWWGYVCGPYYSTYRDTAFTYGGTAGLRWDVSPMFRLKLSVDYKKLNLSGIGDTDMTSGKLGFVWMMQ